MFQEEGEDIQAPPTVDCGSKVLTTPSEAFNASINVNAAVLKNTFDAAKKKNGFELPTERAT